MAYLLWLLIYLGGMLRYLLHLRRKANLLRGVVMASGLTQHSRRLISSFLPSLTALGPPCSIDEGRAHVPSEGASNQLRRFTCTMGVGLQPWTNGVADCSSQCPFQGVPWSHPCAADDVRTAAQYPCWHRSQPLAELKSASHIGLPSENPRAMLASQPSSRSTKVQGHSY